MHRPPPLLLLIVASTLLLAEPAAASWPPGGMLVNSPGSINGVRNARILDMPSGDLCVLGVGRGGNGSAYVIQRVSRDGVITSGWPATGAAFTTISSGTTLRAQSIVVDDASRTWHSWSTASTMLQSFAADATAAPVPAGTAYNLGSAGSQSVHAAPAPGGEVFVTCGSARLERVTAAGTPASGWTTSGVTLPGSGFDDNAILADGNGGVVVFMRGSSVTALPIATRIDGNGALHAGWPAAGLGLSSVSHEAQDISIDSQLLASGPDHALAVWSLDAGSGTRRLMMQRLGLDGTVDPAWPADGLEVVAPDTLRACRALADGSGGAYIVRLSHGLPVATHVTATGVTLGGSDVELVDANAEYVPFLLGETGTPPATVPDDLAVDVTTDGGLLVGWNDARLAPAATFRLRWLTPSLAPAAGKPDTGLVFFPGSPHPPYTNLCAVHADGPDAAFLAWGDYHEVGPQVAGDLWMTRVQLPAPVGVPPAPRATALALSVPRPNPARASVVLDVTLPDDSPTRVELLDVAGRVVRTQLVQGAGAHPVSFGELGTLKPGLYFVRANGPAGSAATRVAVSR